MKKLLLISFILLFQYSTSYSENWSKQALDNVEFNNIKNHCLQIIAIYGSPFRSSGAGGAVFNYLINIGTPTSLEVLKFFVKNGIMPESYLRNI